MMLPLLSLLLRLLSSWRTRYKTSKEKGKYWASKLNIHKDTNQSQGIMGMSPFESDVRMHET